MLGQRRLRWLVHRALHAGLTLLATHAEMQVISCVELSSLLLEHSCELISAGIFTSDLALDDVLMELGEVYGLSLVLAARLLAFLCHLSRHRY